LRNTQEDTGTLEAVRAALNPQHVAQVLQEVASQAVASASSVIGMVPTIEDEQPEQLDCDQSRSESRRRITRDSSSASLDREPKRIRVDSVNRTGVQSHRRLEDTRTVNQPVERELPTEQYTSGFRESPEHRRSLVPVEVPEQPPTRIPSDRSEQSPARASQIENHFTVSGISNEQAHNIPVVWKLEIDGEACELLFTLAECGSFSGMVKLVREVAQSLPSAATLLEKTRLWRLTYPLHNGNRKSQIVRKDTELGFDRMQTDLAQSWSLNQGRIEVELAAIG
jgi:hypothetical protein